MLRIISFRPRSKCILLKLFNVQCPMLFNGIVKIMLIFVISSEYCFLNVMSQNLGSLPSHALLRQGHKVALVLIQIIKIIIADFYGYTVKSVPKI